MNWISEREGSGNAQVSAVSDVTGGYLIPCNCEKMDRGVPGRKGFHVKEND